MTTTNQPKIAKVHMMVNGNALCGAHREGGRQGTDVLGIFNSVGDDERCGRCARLVKTSPKLKAKPAKPVRIAKPKAKKAAKPDPRAKGSPEHLAAAAKAAATRKANRIAKFGEPRPRVPATGNRHLAAVKAHRTRLEASLKGTRGKARAELKAKIANYNEQLDQIAA